MLNYGAKEFVRSYYYSDMKQQRFHVKRDIVNGRLCERFGTHTATTVILNMYKVYDPSVKSSKYVYLGGVARQHPNDHVITAEEEVILAILLQRSRCPQCVVEPLDACIVDDTLVLLPSNQVL